VGKNWFIKNAEALSKLKVLPEMFFSLVGMDSERQERVRAFVIVSVSNHLLTYCHLHTYLRRSITPSLRRFIIPSLDHFITLLLR
jgi:hypothetical protein